MDFENQNILEIGAGSGLTSIILSNDCNTKKVFATDLPDLLPLLQENVSKNKCNNVHVECLDLMDKSEYDKHDDKHDIIIGADIIYDNDITDALIEFLEHILQQDLGKNKHFLFSIEKRYIFTVDDLDTIAPSYEYFMAKLDDLIKKSTFQSKWTFDLSEYYVNDVKQYFCYQRSNDLIIMSINAKIK